MTLENLKKSVNVSMLIHVVVGAMIAYAGYKLLDTYVFSKYVPAISDMPKAIPQSVQEPAQ